MTKINQKEMALDFIVSAFRGATLEKEPSTRDRSVREMKLGPHRIRHRFPFKGGVSGSDLIIDNILKSNALWEKLAK